ncbi:hypothetical protein B0E53_06453 [Micromonospora sp. MH33]|nr:hypothetical protein B0E53_06453 [Micromonospora sp. MH33]
MKVSLPVAGIGPMPSDSRAGPVEPPGIRIQVTASVTWFSSEAWMPATGRSRVRVVMVGAQSGTDSG